MREIKFRAWNGAYNYMAYQGTPDLETLSSFMHHYSDQPLMQFTGRQDNKGDDIYEGDIIISLVQSMRDDSITKVVGEVYFDENLGGYMFGNKNSIDKEADTIEFGVCAALSDSIEIIGNVYENPDLVIGVSKADA